MVPRMTFPNFKTTIKEKGNKVIASTHYNGKVWTVEADTIRVAVAKLTERLEKDARADQIPKR